MKDILIIAAALSNVIGGDYTAVVKKALEQGKPYGGGPEEMVRYFGKHLPAARKLSNTAIEAIDGMVPGFKLWLEVTGFADDKYMILAMMDIANGLAKWRRPSDARIRPSIIPAPQHL